MGKYDRAPTMASGLLRLARQKAGLTQAELAEQAGVAQQTVSAYETGRMEPTIPSLERLVGAAGFELRVHLEPLDDHDRSVQRVLDLLPAEERERLEANQRQRVERARLERVRGR